MELPLNERGYLDSRVIKEIQSTTKTKIEGGEGVTEIHQLQPQLHYYTHVRCIFLLYHYTIGHDGFDVSQDD